MSRECTEQRQERGGGGGGGDRRGPIKCYNCNQEGHISRDCTDRGGGDRRSSSRRNDDYDD